MLRGKYPSRYMRWANIQSVIMNQVFDIIIDNSSGNKKPIPDEYITKLIDENITVVSIICTNITINNLPNHIKELVIDFNYDEPIENLPQQLELLYLGDNFNQGLDYLPIALKTLSIGIEFNQPLDNLPPNLETLEMDNTEFDFSLSNLPASLKTFIRGNNFDRHINDLPDTIENITIHDNENFIENIFATLKLPKKIKKVIVFNYNPREIYDVVLLRKNNISIVENTNYEVIIKQCY